MKGGRDVRDRKPNERLRGLTLRLGALIAFAAAAIAAVGPGIASANYSVVECVPPFAWRRAMLRRFGHSRPARSRSPRRTTAAVGVCGMRLTARATMERGLRGSSMRAPNTILQSAQSTVHYYATGGYGTMTSGDGGQPGYSSVGTWRAARSLGDASSELDALTTRSASSVSQAPARARRRTATSPTSPPTSRIKPLQR